MTQEGRASARSVMGRQIELLSLAEGYLQSSVLFALMKLRVFEHVGEDQKPLDELAAELNTRPQTLARLLNAGVMLKLLETTDGSAYRIAPDWRLLLLSSASEYYLGDWLRLQADFCLALSKLDQAVLQSRPTINPAVYLGADKDYTRAYTMAMHNYASLRGEELAQYLDTSGCTTLLDLGCGAGTYAFQLGLRNSRLRLYLADLPEVLVVARETQSRYPMENEVHYVPLDVTRDTIPGSYDMILASNLLHCFKGGERTELVRRLYQATNPGGSLILQAQHLQENRLGGRWAIFVDLILLCTTESGRNHTVTETKRWLEQAGYINIEHSLMSVYGVNSFVRGYRMR